MLFGRDELLDYFRKADKEKWAVPAFNYSDVWDLQGIIQAANEEAAPIMIAANPVTFKDLGPEMCVALWKGALSWARYPVFLHLDHAQLEPNIYKAIRAGFSSVMIDASAQSLEDNTAVSARVCHFAHSVNVQVEAEIGKIKGGTSAEQGTDGDDWLASAEDAVALCKGSGIDSLAVGIGTAHGLYKGTPKLNFDRLQEINESVDAHLVLHGGTGVPVEDMQRAIRGGINKVNIGTGVHYAYTNGVRDEMERLGRDKYIWEIVYKGVADAKEVVRQGIRMCMAEGKAKPRYQSLG